MRLPCCGKTGPGLDAKPLLTRSPGIRCPQAERIFIAKGKRIELAPGTGRTRCGQALPVKRGAYGNPSPRNDE